MALCWHGSSNLILIGIHIKVSSSADTDFIQLANGCPKRTVCFALIFSHLHTPILLTPKRVGHRCFPILATSALIFSKMALYAGVLTILAPILIMKTENILSGRWVGVITALILSLALFRFSAQRKIHEAVSTHLPHYFREKNEQGSLW